MRHWCLTIVVIAQMMAASIHAAAGSPLFILASSSSEESPYWEVRITQSGQARLKMGPRTASATLSPSAMQRLRKVVKDQRFSALENKYGGRGTLQELTIDGKKVSVSYLSSEFWQNHIDDDPEIALLRREVRRFETVFSAVVAELPREGLWKSMR